MMNINKKYQYLIRVWTFPSLNSIEEQFIFHSDFNADVPTEDSNFWYELFKQHPICIQNCTDW